MKKSTKWSGLLALALIATPSLTACGKSEDAINLRVLNCEDYIGEDEFVYETEVNGEDVALECKNVLDGFEQLMAAQGKKVKVIYDTFDTNETMLSSLKTGQATYDLICPSDYTIQKMLSADMLQKIDFNNIPNYTEYGSKYLLNLLDEIPAELNGKSEHVGDYAVGYMWGTLGVLYNPEKIASDKSTEEAELTEDDVKFALSSWDSLWDERFRGEMSIKDSMRDTYSVGIMHVFDDEVKAKLDASGCFDEDYNLIDGKWDEAVEKYNPLLTEVFNRCDEKTVGTVKEDLLKLKENVFGFEVDSGKEDMVKGMIGMNLAWSGDAVYSMDTAENEQDRYIYYSVPETGGNIWLDGWVIPK
nr:extracellular solute-binding protein [Bacilli bacterium]